ncbi:MAG TPA: universal stress protein [Nitrospirota bacterium]|nr:universal stress protein [Nitrospirota bacterium]
MEYRIILCPIDDVPELSDRSVDTAAYISKLAGARIILLHVGEDWYRSQSVTTDSREWAAIHEEWLDKGRLLLKNAEARVRETGVNNVETVLAEGDPAHEIIAEAKKRKADLIVMSTERHSRIEKFFTGSITDRVTRNTPCSLLLINV